jgi:hypothetical protein
MDKYLELVERFQRLAKITGKSKMNSYEVTLTAIPPVYDSEPVKYAMCLEAADVPGMSTHHRIGNTHDNPILWDDLLLVLDETVKQAEYNVIQASCA